MPSDVHSGCFERIWDSLPGIPVQTSKHARATLEVCENLKVPITSN